MGTRKHKRQIYLGKHEHTVEEASRRKPNNGGWFGRKQTLQSVQVRSNIAPIFPRLGPIPVPTKSIVVVIRFTL